MEDILIIGAGGFALEVIDIIEALNSVNFKYNIIGIIDDYKKDFPLTKYHIIGTTNVFGDYIGVSAVVAIANPKIREKMFDKLAEQGIKTPNLIHPKSEISNHARIQENSGVIVNCYAQISAAANIGKAVIVDSHSYIGHETTIEAFVTIYPGVSISGNCRINEYAEIGLGSNIIQGLTIGKNSFIGAGSTVINNIEENKLAVGVPCKPVKER
jgi:sugar O-acyltransferase (sialic acid O-acetyltransferase NeuD family)